jgi:plasmid rolling circle replication initiator protein Rep
MFKVEDSYGEYFQCLACSRTVDIKLNPAYVPQQRTFEMSSPFYLSSYKALIYGNPISKSDVIGA